MRRFEHVTKFQDNTLYLEFDENGACIIVTDDDRIKANPFYTIKEAEHYVKLGLWKEMEIDDEN